VSDDVLDGTLGGEVKPPAHGSLADLTARAQAAGFPTLADYVDNLEDLAARYEGRRGMVDRERLIDAAVRATPELGGVWPPDRRRITGAAVDAAMAKANERYDGVLRALEDR
jgi:hypothetical protein